VSLASTADELRERADDLTHNRWPADSSSGGLEGTDELAAHLRAMADELDAHARRPVGDAGGVNHACSWRELAADQSALTTRLMWGLASALAALVFCVVWLAIGV
jgi:hypothetical protein